MRPMGRTIALCIIFSACCGTPAAAREIFVDNDFARGFALSAASHHGGRSEIGALTTFEASPGPPHWRLAQWASRYLLEPQACAASGANVRFAETPGKRVVLDRADGTTILRLEIRGSVEYDGRLRAEGEAWPHLLVEQRFPGPIRVDTMKKPVFSVEFRVRSCALAEWARDKTTPGLHTAQVSAFWTVHDVAQKGGTANGGTANGDGMFWFGIPLYDARYPIPPAHYALDTGKSDATHKFIALLDGKRFYSDPTGDGNWHKIQAPLETLLREALEIAQQHGHMANARYEDLALTTFNLGWEIPGPYDAAIELRGLSLKTED